MPNMKNLRPFQSGNDPRRNTKGRPIGAKGKLTTLKSLFMEELSKIPKGGDLDASQIIVKKMVSKAMSGDLRAIKMITDIVDGKPGKERKEKILPSVYPLTDEQKQKLNELL